MATIDTDAIWEALGSFYNFFPENERVYYAVFWEALADVVADLWGYALQVNRAKSVFTTRPTFERLNVLLKLDNFSEIRALNFELSSFVTSPEGLTTVRGFVPRGLRTFTSQDVPLKGLIRIGVDTLAYSAVNIVSIEGGLFDGFVREVTFTLTAIPPRDYGDSLDFNDQFFRDDQQLIVRVNQVAGLNFVDAVLIDINEPVTVNPTGRLIVGEPGFNAETFEYESVTVIADRYVFTLSSTFRDPETTAPLTGLAHLADEPVSVLRYDPNKWLDQSNGAARIFSDNQATLLIDDKDGGVISVPARAELVNKFELKDNIDFDVSVFADLDVMETPVAALTERLAGAELTISGRTYFIGIRSTSVGNEVAFGLVGSLSTQTLTLLPDGFEARFKRIGAKLELLFREQGEQEFDVLDTITVTGGRARMALVIDDGGTESASQVSFDEVLRRLGEVVGSSRLESTFLATENFPYRYDIDQRVTEASSLRDRPRLHDERAVVAEQVTDFEQTVLRLIGGEDFEIGGVLDAGVIIIDGKSVVYEGFDIKDSILEFRLRRKLDPDLIPLAVNTDVIIATRDLPNTDFFLTGTGRLHLRDLTTRDGLWAPVAQVDVRHVQKSWGKLVDLDTEVSTESYLRKVQGTWFALWNGPAIDNVHTGLQLTMGLPAATRSGTVDRIDQTFDALGNLINKTLVIVNEDGEFEHSINPDLPSEIDFIYNPGDRVNRFDPLTNGVEVVDVVTDDLWYQRFAGDIADAERFNAFGVFVAIEALTAEASFEDAIRFALRIKGTWTKLILRFLLLGGNEDIIIEEDLFVAQVTAPCEDLSFDEGPAPPNFQDPLIMGDGHKMGQGKMMGGPGVFQVFPQLGLGLFMGQGLTMSMAPRAIACDPLESNLPTEIVSPTQVMTFVSPP